MLCEQLVTEAGLGWEGVLARCSGGLDLLYRAVRSGSSAMVQQVLAWGERHGRPFNWQVRSGACVSSTKACSIRLQSCVGSEGAHLHPSHLSSLNA